MSWKSSSVLIAAAGLLAIPAWVHAAGFPPTPTALGGAKVTVVAQGLLDPRGLVQGPAGDLYVAEAGTTEGVFTPPAPPPPDPSTLTRNRCFINWPLGPATGGHTGRISRIDRAGHRSTVAAGFPSTGFNSLVGGDRMGVGAVAFLGNSLYAITPGGGCAHGHDRADPTTLNALVRVGRGGPPQVVADLGYFLETNPDSKSELTDDFEPQGTWYSVISAFGALYTMEPNHGVLVRVERNGAISRVADLWDMVSRIDAAGDGDKTFTALIRHRNAFYIGTLGQIEDGLAAFIYRLSPDGAVIKQVASGLHGVVGIAFDRRGRLYALETQTGTENPPFSGATNGRLVRVERNGTLTPIVTGLAFPSALLAGRRGEFYISNCGYHCDDRSNFPASLPSLQSGQVLKVVIPGGDADCDDPD